MQKRGFLTREYSAPTHDQQAPSQCTAELIATNDSMQKSEPWDRYTKSTIYIKCARSDKGALFDPFFR